MTMIDDTTGAAVVGHLIAGVQSAGDRTFAVRNPSRVEEVVGVVAEGSAADAGAAVDAAAEAATSWATTSVPERVERLHRIADAIDGHAGLLVDLATREIGSIVSTIRREVASAAD